jgi:hypothetical protein
MKVPSAHTFYMKYSGFSKCLRESLDAYTGQIDSTYWKISSNVHMMKEDNAAASTAISRRRGGKE